MSRKSVLERIMARIEDGCFTPAAVLRCPECRQNVFDLSEAEILVLMNELVAAGRVEKRPQGGQTDMTAGAKIQLYVPAGMPAGNHYRSNRPRGDEMMSGKGE